MLKKIVLLFIIVLLQLNSTSVYAKTIEVTALNVFDSTNPPKNFSVRLNEDLIISEEQTIYKNSILKGYIYEVIPPKRLKQSASFIYIPTSYVDYSQKYFPITNVVSQYATKGSLKGVALTSAAVLAVGAVPALIAQTGYYAAEGALKNEDGNRLKSSADEAYNKSYLSIGKVGDELYINKNQNFLLNFVIIKNQEPNYEYTHAD